MNRCVWPKRRGLCPRTPGVYHIDEPQQRGKKAAPSIRPPAARDAPLQSPVLPTAAKSLPARSPSVQRRTILGVNLGLPLTLKADISIAVSTASTWLLLDEGPEPIGDKVCPVEQVDREVLVDIGTLAEVGLSGVGETVRVGGVETVGPVVGQVGQVGIIDTAVDGHIAGQRRTAEYKGERFAILVSAQPIVEDKRSPVQIVLRGNSVLHVDVVLVVVADVELHGVVGYAEIACFAFTEAQRGGQADALDPQIVIDLRVAA